MPIALSEEQSALAESVAKLAARYSALDVARNDPSHFTGGARGEGWDALVKNGLHAVHLPEQLGGQGGGLLELAVVVEECGRALTPGPLVPTVIASTAISDLEGPVAARVVEEFASGATGAIVGSAGLTATASSGGWVINGVSLPALGARAADVLIVGAFDGGDTRWFRVDPAAAGVTLGVDRGVDLTRDITTVTLDGVVVEESDLLTGLDADRVSVVSVALLAAEASGIFRWLIESVTDYIKVREQFGRPVGAFQALGHRAARLLVASELASAAAWDAVRGLDATPPQQRLASSAAAVVALGRIVDATVEAVSMFGGIAFTWEHDLHLYQRRAMSIASLAGPASQWAERLGETHLIEARDFSIDLAGGEESFRAEIAGLLDRAAALEGGEPVGSERPAVTDQRIFLAEAGLITPYLPEPYGVGAGPAQQLIIAEEYARAGVHRPNLGIGEWLLPTLVLQGTDEQKDRFAAATLTGEYAWCQLFSEPDAGSDVAAVATRAEKVDGGWIVNGQKVWTSLAHVADFGATLVRTDPSLPKHAGLSYLIVDLHAPGVTVCPLRQSTGQSHFNEVFFDDVFVPEANLIGEENRGWEVAIATMANERLSIAGIDDSGNEARIKAIIEQGRYAGTREAALSALGEVAAEGAAVAALNMRETLRALAGGQPGPATSIAKLAATGLRRMAAQAAYGLLGPTGAVDDPEGVIHSVGGTGDDVAFAVLDIPTWVLGGGTAEIQLNIIAQFILGLPRAK